jgi:hypothetical protein
MSPGCGKEPKSNETPETGAPTIPSEPSNKEGISGGGASSKAKSMEKAAYKVGDLKRELKAFAASTNFEKTEF